MVNLTRRKKCVLEANIRRVRQGRPVVRPSFSTFPLRTLISFDPVNSLPAYEYSLAHVHSLAPFSPEAQEAAVAAIATALTLPGVFDFDPLFKLDAVVAANENPIFALLQVFLNGGLEEYNAWESANVASVLAQSEYPA